MKKSIAIFTLLFTLVLTIGLVSGCKNVTSQKESKSSLEQIKESGKIRIGVFSDKAPFGYIDENGEPQGYDVYFGKRIAKDLLGDENAVEFVSVEAASRVEFLETNKVDIILANFTVTDERKEKVDFALPYMKVALGIVTPDASPITDVSQLKGKKLIVNKGTTAETYFTKNYPNIELLKYDENTAAFNALLDKRGDAIAHDNTLLFAWVTKNKGYTTSIDSLGSVDTIAPAVKKGNKELVEWLNEEIKTLGKENFFHSDYDATLLPVYGDAVDPESVVVEGGEISK
ncbi:cysteine ABC transporter substrate-binding protein [Clostridioides mangenotii]|uniref:cysteine ABC transporter substrate-binding protein n=1 Tax=Metaclostridioides mangenotii TaxID=1540 RepID=UPI001C1225F2|nr:cysteine ABC transporter substrate-binding protein [Clostridioides mangenotii]MBU5307905.1 cysteine ABC transporter substrate-binding protein [Clostridioides mangenotii]